ncbi:helix-turn-helix domain-containing protein [Novosphingobium sp. KN65.2]|uniref:helix-turn-helix domain-containing protein n=1 Tax=Novosphingobium sp. KN65.2 TaxID=1478134 RepID=UPI0005E45D55|nr:helix-turn-helix transcriptional regulator [Novosphingobium sp. KN65.2]CDO37998.1 putative transcriptional regulator [Novosphingobium sp. KN65.2]
MAEILHLDDMVLPEAILFGTRLKRHRQALGLSQMDLASRAGKGKAYISMLERGQANPSLETMVKLADAVGQQAWEMIRPDDA